MNFIKVWERIKNETDLKNLRHLSEIVGKTHQNISARKKKNIFPIEWAYLVGKKFNLSTEWILTGQGPKKLNEVKTRGKPKSNFLNLVDEWLQELTKEEPQRAEWFQLQFKDSFPSFKKWVQQRETKRAGKGNTDMDSKVA